MSIKAELDNLNKQDVYSIMLFALYKLKEHSSWASLSQLAYILDYDALLKLCTIFGGLTITIPKIAELKEMLNGMMIYQAIDLENKDSSEVLMQYNKGDIDAYLKIREVLRDYTLSSRSNFNA